MSDTLVLDTLGFPVAFVSWQRAVNLQWQDRAVVVTEDARTGSFGQAIVTESVGSQARFNRFLSPPLLVAREDGHIPFNPVLEYAVLPDAARVHAALAEVMQ